LAILKIGGGGGVVGGIVAFIQDAPLVIVISIVIGIFILLAIVTANIRNYKKEFFSKEDALQIYSGVNELIQELYSLRRKIDLENPNYERNHELYEKDERVENVLFKIEQLRAKQGNKRFDEIMESLVFAGCKKAKFGIAKRPNDGEDMIHQAMRDYIHNKLKGRGGNGQQN